MNSKPLTTTSVVRPVLVIMIAAAAGFLVGEALRPEEPSAQARESRDGISPVSSAPLAADAPPPPAIVLPAIDFDDTDGFETYVQRLTDLGLSQELAQWLSLQQKSRQDLSASLLIARDRKLLDVWAETAAAADPQKAFDLLQSLPFKEQSGVVGPFFAALGRTDPETGLELALQLPAHLSQSSIVSLVDSWTSIAPPETVATIVAQIPPPRQRDALFAAFRAWGKTDPEAMVDWAESLGPHYGNLGFRTLYQVRDPTETLDLAARHPDSAYWLILAYAASELSRNGAEAFATIDKLPDGYMRDATIRHFAVTLSQRNPAAALALVKTLKPGDRALFLKTSARKLGSFAPLEVAEMIQHENLGPASLLSLMNGWAEKDAPQAANWARANLKASTLFKALDDIYSTWSGQSPAEAAASLDSLPPGQRAPLLPKTAAAYAEKDPQTALAWAAKLSPLERMRVTASIFEGWATRDAWAAAEALQKQPPDPALDDAFPRVGRAFANIDGEAATAWAAKLPETDTRNRTISAIIDSWGSRDAAAASAYLDKLPPGDFRDHAVDGFVDSVLNLDPESAAVWAHSIQDPDRRRRKLGNTLRYWRFKDQPAAQRFVQSLPAGELREQMLEVVNE